MKCRTCNGEMQQGYIQNSNIIYWYEKPSPVAKIPQLAQNRVQLTNEFSGIAKGSLAEAYICKNCREVVIKY